MTLASHNAVETRCQLPALIMAGGRSERMRATAGIHKALVSVSGKPLIQRNIETLLAEGFVEIVIAISAHAPELESYILGEGRALARSAGASLTCVKESSPRGTIGAAHAVIGTSEALLVVNVDNLTDLPLRALTSYHFQTDACLTIAFHYEPFRIPFGQLIVEDDQVIDYREKPSFPVAVSSGTYVIGLEASRLIETHGRFDITDLFQAARDSGMKIAAFKHDSRWIDVNDAASLKRAEELFGALTVPGEV